MKTGTLETRTRSDVTSHDGFFGQLRIAITGGTSGLGLALVREFSARGARVAFLARHAEPVAKVARENKNTHGIVADVSDKDAIYPAALQIVGELGGLEILINNASDLGAVPLALLADTNCEDLEKAVATNVLGPFRLTKALLGALSASVREGRAALVINISSDAAVTPYPKWGAYGASKAALRHLTEIWNQELSVVGVRFLSFDPGDMDTPMHALAVPDADRTTLKTAEAAARELLTAIETALTRPATRDVTVEE
jgi:NAD(P)-dependent dehydrogenase (short-subunit alcohol dehydrogenase family)